MIREPTARLPFRNLIVRGVRYTDNVRPHSAAGDTAAGDTASLRAAIARAKDGEKNVSHIAFLPVTTTRADGNAIPGVGGRTRADGVRPRDYNAMGIGELAQAAAAESFAQDAVLFLAAREDLALAAVNARGVLRGSVNPIRIPEWVAGWVEGSSSMHCWS